MVEIINTPNTAELQNKAAETRSDISPDKERTLSRRETIQKDLLAQAHSMIRNRKEYGTILDDPARNYQIQQHQDNASGKQSACSSIDCQGIQPHYFIDYLKNIVTYLPQLE